MPEPSVRAAGGVVWRWVDSQLQVALVHRPKYDDWSLPKGKLKQDEPWVVGGLREVHEETGFLAQPGRRLGESRYRVLDRGRDAAKTVRWWSMRCLAGAFEASEEVDVLRWATVPDALAQASAFDVGPLTAFASGPVETTTLLLLDGAAPEPVVAAYRPERELAPDDLEQVLKEVAVTGSTAVVREPPWLLEAYGEGSWVLSLDGGQVVEAAPLLD